MTPLVTIGIPFRNPGRFFKAAVQSVFSQSFSDWELILLDDGSHDGSLEFAKSISDPRVSVVSDGLSLGLSCRLNQLARLAKGTYCFRMDADDIMHPLRVETQLEILEKSSEDTVTGTSAWFITAENQIKGVIKPRPGLPGFGVRYSFIHPSVAARTSWFLVNQYSEDPVFRRAQDVELWCRTQSRSKFILIDKPLVYYRESDRVGRIQRYAGSSRALLQILRKYYSRPAAAYLYNATSVLIKTFLFMLAEFTGWGAAGMRRHIKKVSDEDLKAAESDLMSVLSCNLPVSENRDT